jgi:rod shape-determining protein MreB
MKNNIRPADYYIAVPWDVTEVEKRAFKDLVKESNVKAKRVMIVDKAVADGLGQGIDVKNSQGVLVVNVGFDTTEISILSLGGIVLSKLIKVGGRKFDDAIKAAIRREYSLIVGGKTAEVVKMSLNDLEETGMGAVVYGRDIVTGLPVEREIPTSLVDECLTEHFNTIIDNIKVILERTPPELAADIYRHGIYLTGGASQVSRFANLVSKGTGLMVNVSENPVTSVALGLAKIINDDNYKSVAYAIEGMSK